MSPTYEITTAYGTFSGQHLSPGNELTPLILFLHGFPDDSDVWSHQVKELGKDFEIVALNLYKHSFRNQVNGLGQFVADNCNRKIMIVAHDMGGPVACEIAMNNADRISKLFLINTLSLGQFIRRWRHPRQWVKSFYMPLMIGPLHNIEKWQSIGKLIRSAAYDLGGLEKSDLIRSSGLECLEGVRLYRELFKGLPARILSEHKSLTTETHILFGTSDPFLELPQNDELSQHFENYKLKVLPAGHWVQRTHAEEVNQWIRKVINNG